MGADHRIFAPLGRWSRRWQTPVGALIAQAAISIATVLIVGACGFGRRGFDAILEYTAPVFWLFFLLTGLSLFVLRWREPDVERPFRVPGYPVTPLLFCAWCAYMLVATAIYAGALGLVGLGVLALGLPLYALSRRLPPARNHGKRCTARFLLTEDAGAECRAVG
jgi:amino acid transporter